MIPLHWVQPGPLDKRTGGFIYNRRIITGLRERGISVELHCLPESFPAPDADARKQAVDLLAQIPDGARLIIDGLAFGVLADEFDPHAERLNVIALCHHPLALESGLSKAQVDALFTSEKAAFRHVRAVITTSNTTIDTLGPYQLNADIPIVAILPGVDVAPIAAGSGSGAGSGGNDLQLLCVASLTARKGHSVLIEALAGMTDRPWHLTCAGGAQHEPATASDLSQQITTSGLTDRIDLVGELDEAALDQLYDQADLFVLPSYHEGYGMVLVEAMARGLPIISTQAGAIPETVPKDAGLLVPPGNAVALRQALETLIDDPTHRGRLAAGARDARLQLRPWTAAIGEFAPIVTGP